MKEVAKYKGCFVCGDRNEIGLKAKFFFDGSKATAEYIAQRQYEGYADILHGGITAALLDEVMIKALLAREIYAMTAEISVRYHKAVMVGQKLFLEGMIEKENDRLFVVKGEARLENGVVAATAVGKYLKVRDSMKIKLMESLKR
jgi:acyl-coenzyme A thioesterase PaaI-like protein